MGERRIAAFDFDGTITNRDTLLPFLARSCGRRAFGQAMRRAGRVAARARLTGAAAGVSGHHRDASKAVLIRELFSGRSVEWLADAGTAYAREVLPGLIRPEMAQQLKWHRDNGHELVMVSASLDAYLAPFGLDHGFATVIAVTLAADEHGLLTGELARPNVRGREKAARLREWLVDDEPAFVWAYGNSSGDRELLALADEPVWVGRRRRSLAARSRRGPAVDRPERVDLRPDASR